MRTSEFNRVGQLGVLYGTLLWRMDNNNNDNSSRHVGSREFGPFTLRHTNQSVRLETDWRLEYDGCQSAKSHHWGSLESYGIVLVQVRGTQSRWLRVMRVTWYMDQSDSTKVNRLVMTEDETVGHGTKSQTAIIFKFRPNLNFQNEN